MANTSAHGTCPGGTECVSYSMFCTDARCICRVENGRDGPGCNGLTLRSLPMLIGRVGEVVAFVPLGFVCGIQLRRTWLASKDAKRTWIFNFLMAPLALIVCGIVLFVADAVEGLLIATATIHLTSVEGTVWTNLVNGLGIMFFNLGFAVIPMLWCEIGIASSRFRRMHDALRLSRRVLVVFLILNVITAAGLAVVGPMYPFYAEQWLGLVSFVSAFIVVVTHSTGAWMLSRALSTTQGVRPESVPEESRRGEGINVETATQQATLTARYFTRYALAALLGVVLWQLGHFLAYSHSDHKHSSPILVWVGIGLIKLVGIVRLSVCELRYIRWATEAAMGSHCCTSETVTVRCRNDERTSYERTSYDRTSCASRLASCDISFDASLDRL